MKLHAGGVLLWLVTAFAAVIPAFGSPSYTVDLNSASSFALLGSTITQTGTSDIEGDVGATTTITDNSPGWTVSGTVFPAGGATAETAYSDFESAFTNAYGLSPSQATLSSLGTTQTFVGNNVYAFTSTISTTTGTGLTFDAQNDPTEIFIIQIQGDLTVNGALTFNLINGAQASNIYWVVEDDATISVGSSGPIAFDGSILAGDAFTMSAASGGSGVLAGTIDGCVFSENANTLAGTTDVSGCSASGASVPEPGSSGLSLAGLLGILAWGKFRFRASRNIVPDVL